MTAEEAHAVQVASKALELPLLHYNVSLAVTTRMYCRYQVEAVDLDHCRQLVEQVDWSEVGRSGWAGGDWHLDHEDIQIEGDEIAYIEDADEIDALDRIDEEVDLRGEGAPYSWDAARFVMRLARLQIEETDVGALIQEARALCKS